jgi:hypothetical protein
LKPQQSKATADRIDRLAGDAVAFTPSGQLHCALVRHHKRLAGYTVGLCTTLSHHGEAIATERQSQRCIKPNRAAERKSHRLPLDRPKVRLRLARLDIDR